MFNNSIGDNNSNVHDETAPEGNDNEQTLDGSMAHGGPQDESQASIAESEDSIIYVNTYAADVTNRKCSRYVLVECGWMVDIFNLLIC